MKKIKMIKTLKSACIIATLLFAFNGFAICGLEDEQLHQNADPDDAQINDANDVPVVTTSKGDQLINSNEPIHKDESLTPIDNATSLASGYIQAGKTKDGIITTLTKDMGYTQTEAEIAYEKAFKNTSTQTSMQNELSNDAEAGSIAIDVTSDNQAAVLALDQNDEVMPSGSEDEKGNKVQQKPLGKFKTGVNYEPRGIVGLFKLIIFASRNGCSKEEIKGLIQKYLRGEDVTINTSAGTVTITSNPERYNALLEAESAKGSDTSRANSADSISTQTGTAGITQHSYYQAEDHKVTSNNNLNNTNTQEDILKRQTQIPPINQ